MYINRKKKFIFIHIPKTGGISARVALWGPRIVPHRSALHIRESKPRIFERSFKFAFTRNHWARFVSAYEFLKKGGLTEWDVEASKRVNQYKNIKELLRANDPVLDWAHFKPQWLWVCDNNANLLVDFIGKMEEMQDGIDFIKNKTGINPRKLKKLNATSHRHYSDYFDEESLGLFSNRYEKDISLFKYTYGD